jgi:hypothetical protein
MDDAGLVGMSTLKVIGVIAIAAAFWLINDPIALVVKLWHFFRGDERPER